MSYSLQITKEEINALPALQFEGKIEIIESIEHAQTVAVKLASEKLLGFDTETRPSFSKGESYQVALLQLATADCAYLFRLNKMPLIPELLAILSSDQIQKAGVAILDDVRALQKMRDFSPAGFVDLSKVAEQNGISSVGLRALTAIFLGKRLLKGAKLTNWNTARLSPAQIHYAANDASVGLQIYQRMQHLQLITH
jgi:ribonuclease D